MSNSPSMVQPIDAYRTHDGRLFECEKAAAEHAADLLGAELDGLLRLAELDITRQQEYKALMTWLNNRQELKASIAAIHSLLNYGE